MLVFFLMVVGIVGGWVLLVNWDKAERWVELVGNVFLVGALIGCFCLLPLLILVVIIKWLRGDDMEHKVNDG